MPEQTSALHQRVWLAAHAVLERDGSVGPLELLREMRLLDGRHFDQWLRGHAEFPDLASRIQCGREKLQSTYREFADWAASHGLATIEFHYARASVNGTQPLTVTADGTNEVFFHTHFTSADESSKQRKKAERARAKAPELTVFLQTGDASPCSECQVELVRGSWVFLEGSTPLCLDCADLAHLEFLPSGDAALTRRAKKHSSLSAVVVEFNRRRKRYERRGLLVTSDAVALAESECAADAPERAQRRVKAAEQRVVEDRDFVAEFSAAILSQFPACPLNEAQQIAEHAAVRGSGRVGRSAAAKVLAEEPIKLAVIASIRHRHTNYDALLMKGVPRRDARSQIQSKIEKVLREWKVAAQ